MGIAIVDASVVIALLDNEDAHHDRALAALESCVGYDLRLPVSAYAEALIGPAKTNHAESARDRILGFVSSIEPATAAIAERAAVMRAGKPALSLADAFVLATASYLGAEVVLTTDRALQDVLPSVRVLGRLTN